MCFGSGIGMQRSGGLQQSRKLPVGISLLSGPSRDHCQSISRDVKSCSADVLRFAVVLWLWEKTSSGMTAVGASFQQIVEARQRLRNLVRHT